MIPVVSRQERLKEALVPVLYFVRERWAEWAQTHSRAQAAQGIGMCRYTAAFLATEMKPRWRFTGGAQDWVEPVGFVGAGGYFDGRLWHPHHWVTDGELIIDLAAEQFGGAAIEVTGVEDPRYCANYLMQECVDAVRGVAQGVKAWCQLYVPAGIELELPKI